MEKHKIEGNPNGEHYCHTCRDWFRNGEEHREFIKRIGLITKEDVRHRCLV